ncbi:MAG: CDP-glycerol glycerophosphotransferase family protein [Thermomicrobiales bacterium]
MPRWPSTESIAGLCLYWLNACSPKYSNKVILHSFPDYSDEVISLATELVGRGWRPVVLLEQASAPQNSSWIAALPVRATAKNSFRGRYDYFTSRMVITSHGVYRPHRPVARQQVINLWHGELGKPVARFLSEAPPIRPTRASAMSNIARAFVCAEFDLHPDKVVIVGAPRNDRMLTTDRIGTRAKLTDGRRIKQLLVWLPTYRDRGPGKRHGKIDGIPFDGPVPLTAEELARLDEWLAAHDALLVVKPHPSALRPTGGPYRHIVVYDQHALVERSVTTGELLGAADCLITDASTVWVDFLLQDRPMFFVFPDIDDYEVSRGLYLQPYEAWLPGPLILNGVCLLAHLDKWAAGQDDFGAHRRTIKVLLHRYVDAHSTARLLDELLL